MSALARKADMLSIGANVRYVPLADFFGHQTGAEAHSLSQNVNNLLEPPQR
jgi:hypothetical protein